MITAIVNFELPAPIALAEAEQAFTKSVPKYKGLDGLVRKYYLLSEDGKTGGGVYLWRSRRHAEQFYTEEWRQFIRDKYGCEPKVAYFESPVIVENDR